MRHHIKRRLYHHDYPTVHNFDWSVMASVMLVHTLGAQTVLITTFLLGSGSPRQIKAQLKYYQYPLY